MPWNYRIVRLDRSVPDEPVYRIWEIRYDDAGAIQAYAEGAAGLVGRDLHELRWVHARIADAFDRDILLESDFPPRRDERRETLPVGIPRHSNRSQSTWSVVHVRSHERPSINQRGRAA